MQGVIFRTFSVTLYRKMFIFGIVTFVIWFIFHKIIWTVRIGIWVLFSSTSTIVKVSFSFFLGFNLKVFINVFFVVVFQAELVFYSFFKPVRRKEAFHHFFTRPLWIHVIWMEWDPTWDYIVYTSFLSLSEPLFSICLYTYITPLFMNECNCSEV